MGRSTARHVRRQRRCRDAGERELECSCEPGYRMLSKLHKTDDPEARITGLRRLLSWARRRRQEELLRICLRDVAFFHWRLGRPEGALRYAVRLLKRDPKDMVGWIMAAKIARVLGRPRGSLGFATRALALLGRGSDRWARRTRAELAFEAAISARLLGDRRSAAQYLKRYLASRPGVLLPEEREQGRLLLAEATFEGSKEDAVKLSRAARARLCRDRRDPSALAAMALSAEAAGDSHGAKRWWSRAVTRAAVWVAHPFRHDLWQLAFVILRRMRAPATQDAGPPGSPPHPRRGNPTTRHPGRAKAQTDRGTG